MKRIVGNLELAKLLIKHGANINTENSLKVTPLQDAVISGK